MKSNLTYFSVACSLLIACSTTNTPKTNTVESASLLKVGNKAVSTDEFKYVYNKNNASQADAFTEKSLREYLDLYIKFRLKVQEAEELGLDTTKEFKKELSGYKSQLAQPYLTEKSVTERLIKEAYQRMNEEVKAAHILLRVAPDADPKDSLAVYNRIMDIRKKAVNGENFESLARSYSEDPSAQSNGGNLGYFSALQMVYPFEDGAYKTNVGEISMPVRSKFGYHLIKVFDKRVAKGEVKVAHIMVRYSTGTNPSDSVAGVRKINEISAKLSAGAKWETLCSEFSDDMNSRGKGGELPAFSTGQMIPSFEEAAFSLNNAGDISKPIQTQYGFHILKLLDRKPIQKFEQVESSLKAKVAKDSRSDLSKTFLLARLKKENNFTENTKNQQVIFAYADSSLLKGKFVYVPQVKESQLELFSIGNKKYLAQEFISYVKAKQKIRNGISAKNYIGILFRDFVNESLLGYEESNLESKYLDYKMLVKEYRDGILLFQLMDNKVWSKAIEDTAGLKKYFNDNKENYRWGKRCDATIYNCKDKATLDILKSKLGSKMYDVTYEKGGKVIFASGKTEIQATDKKALDEIKNILNRDPNYFVEISASADAGEAKSNKKSLSKLRLSTVYKYLASIGVDTNRIIKIDLGTAKVTAGKKPGVESKFVSYKYVSTSITALEKSMNTDAPLTVQIKSARFQKGDDEVMDSFEWKYDDNIFEKNGRTYMIKISAILEPQTKTFEEAKGVLIADYQNFLEKDWIKSLQAKYKVEIVDTELKKLIK
jgi:peptidyl-prolyl cis-trans isomerase SurA